MSVRMFLDDDSSTWVVWDDEGGIPSVSGFGPTKETALEDLNKKRFPLTPITMDQVSIEGECTDACVL
jgi:hypothetical protein